ncbi:hypothetical protein G2W53_040082 [Senna tora]|uniref:Transposase MuDR plant domain-containing protein n=1 Tax=Senna tora TaxID=362788 RepID=A0A834W6R4_9FABA|nr:hypothetical protein G2W53_040082 [Senna tora]
MLFFCDWANRVWFGSEFGVTWCSSMEFFSVDVHYGGSLEGDPTFSYHGGLSASWENCDIDKWSCCEIKDCLEELGVVDYRALWFRLPGHSLEDGLKPILNDKDSMAMAEIATKNRKVDEDNNEYESEDSALKIRFNDSEEEVDYNGDHGLFDVEVAQAQTVEAQEVEVQAMEQSPLDNGNATQSNHESTVENHGADNRNATETDDAPMEKRNVKKKKVNRKKKADRKTFVQVKKSLLDKEGDGSGHKGLSDDEYESESLASMDSDEENEGLPKDSRFPIFKMLRDMFDYDWEIGTIFLMKDDFKEAIATYAAHTGRDLYFEKSNSKRVRVKCAGKYQGEDCDWEAYAKKLNNEETWQVTTIYGRHSCSKTHDVKLMSSRWLSKKLEKKVRYNPKMTLKDIIDKAQQKWTVNCSMSKASRARKVAREEINGSFTEQFRRLYDFCEEIRSSDPGSNVKLKVQRLPTAGLLPALDELLPGVDQRFCVRHLYNNFRKKFPDLQLKNLMWNAAKATYRQEWERAMLEIREVNEAAYQYLMQIPPRHWRKSAFTPGPKSDQLLNNMCDELKG